MKNQKLNCAFIILAGGEGKRMNSDISKILHKIANQPMIERTINTLKQLNPEQVIIVANTKNTNEIKKYSKNCQLIIQKEPKGTADATKVGLSLVSKKLNSVVVMYGDDSAFYTPKTISRLYERHIKSKSVISFVTLIKENPKGLGRIIRKKGKISGIIEEKDATKKQKEIKEINDGLYFFDKSFLQNNLPLIKPSETTGELYLVDTIALAIKNNLKVQGLQLDNPKEWHGINTQEELSVANKEFAKKIHFMGIGGAGASAVANIAKSQGFQVSGCDSSKKSAYLSNNQIQYSVGHHQSHISNNSMLIVSPAVQKMDNNNSEINYAYKNNIAVISWQEFQAEYLQRGKFTIAVAGGYGKSTTTALISQILIDQKLNPTCEIGAKVLSWERNFNIGKSKYYVFEADEYNDNFLNYKVDIAIILNFNWDHPDYFKSQQQLINSYLKFINNIKNNGTLIIADNLKSHLKNIRPDIKITTIKNYDNVKLQIIGDFRKENASAAITLAQSLNLNLDEAIKSVENFKGLARRLEYKGEIKNTKFYDDYAVQPYTVLTTINALSAKYPNNKIALVFEPHTYSRIERFFNDFTESLNNANVDSIFITDIYAAREKGKAPLLAKKLVRFIEKSQYTGSIKQTAVYLKKIFTKFDVICTMGAGDSWQLWDLIK